MAVVETVEPPHKHMPAETSRSTWPACRWTTAWPLFGGKNEIDFFKARGVYTKVQQELWMKVITVKLIDHSKGD